MALVIIFGILIVKLDDPITDITGISGLIVDNAGMSIFCLGIFGAIWQMLSVKHVCPGCKKDTMIPVDTPKGRHLMIDAGPLVYESSIDATAPVAGHDDGVIIEAESTLILRAVIISVFYIPKSPVYKRCVEGITENLTARSIIQWQQSTEQLGFS